MLKNVKIKKLLYLGFGGTIGLLMVFILMLFGLVVSQKTAYQSLLDHQVEANQLATTCRLDVNIIARNIREMIITKSDSAREDMGERINEVLGSVHNSLDRLAEVYPNDDTLVDDYTVAVQKLEEVNSGIISLIKEGKLQSAADAIDKSASYMDNVIAIGTKLDNALSESEQVVLERIEKKNFVSVIILVVIIAVILLAAINFVRKLVKSIVDPTHEVHDALVGFSEGNLNVPVEFEGDNEFGEMCTALRNSQATLKEVIADECYLLEEMANGNFGVRTQKPESYVGDLEAVLSSIRVINRTLSDTIRQINQSSEQVNSGSQQVASGAQALAQGATEQSSSVEELAATIAEISERINNTSDNAQQAKNQASETGDVVVLCNKQMQDMKTAMDEINQKSSDISKIIKTIEDIAFQTNILALNAAVEAARAGSAGKGFAVVADEVRNLAGKSAEASKNTATLITGSIAAVENGLNLVHETAESLEKVVQNTEATSEMIDRIAKASNEQAVAIAQINEGIDQISSVVQTNSATAEESAAASEELSGQAAILENLVSTFRLGDEMEM